MSKSYRIRTKPGEDDGYLKVNLDLNQNYDFLEILSLKISQKEEYQGFCADYGVIAGRIDINNGFGVPNVKVSIFVPIEESDVDNPLISELYPYTSPSDGQKNSNGIRYNLLPNKQQNFDHTPVGTIPSKREMLDNKTTLEIYEKYYKYTTTTNKAGDFILFGVPVGEHTLHYDMDVSDIGFISARPYELISQGYSEDLFENRFKFKSNNNLNNLTQIFSENISVDVLPYWCDSLKVGNTLGIVRKDISIDLDLIPTAIFTGSIFSDDEKDSLNKNCRPDRDMGKMNEVITNSGKIEAIRRTVDGTIESYEIKGNSIDDNGNWSLQIPMNLRKVVTDEFGKLIPSPDGIKGIATESDMRFRISMDASDTDKRLRQRVKFLVPNMTGNYNFSPVSYEDLRITDKWVKNEQLSTVTVGTPYEDDLTNQYNYIEDFFTFRWKKVYTVKQYIGRYQKSQNDETRGFIGIKDIVNGFGVNKFPSNRVDTTIHPLYTIICIILSLFAHLVGVINGIIQFINGLITTLCNIKIPIGICARSEKGSKIKVYMQANEYQGGWEKVSGTVCTDKDSGTWTRCGREFSPCIDTNTLGGGDPEDCSVLGLNHATWRVINANTSSARIQRPSEDGTGWDTVSYSGSYNGITFYSQGGNGGTGYFPIYLAVGNNSIVGNSYVYAPTSFSSAAYTYNYSSSSCNWNTGVMSDGCRRFRTGNNVGNEWWNDSECKKCNITISPACQGIKLFGVCWELRYWCLISAGLCQNCGDYCGPNWDCSNLPQCGSSGDCCDDGKCCIRIPLIGLKCAEEELTIKPSIIPNNLAGGACNATYVRPFSCYTCGGLQTPDIKEWVGCVLEPVATFLKMLKLDFYNDWVGGSLYFPLIKRKYKVRSSKKKFGQIKKDKFCHYNCRSKGPTPSNFQGGEVFTQDRIKLKLDSPYAPVSFNLQGCNINIEGNIVSNYFGDTSTTQGQNLNNASKTIKLKGFNDSDEKCQVGFDSYSSLNQSLGNNAIAGLQLLTEQKESASVYSEPNYVRTEDQFGQETWVNEGGFGLHRNICDPVRLIERKEYFKDELDCTTTGPEGSPDVTIDIEDDGTPSGTDPNTPCLENCKTLPGPNLLTSYTNACCKSSCSSNGVAGCNIFCPCNDLNGLSDYNGNIIEHGLVKWYDKELYYASIIPPDDATFNSNEYKGNLLLPTTIMELGSTSYCDIDDIPFIMDKLQPTTYQISTESVKYKTSYNSGTNPKKYDLTYGDDKSGGINLRAYVEFSCISTVCLNTQATVNQAQIGVDLISTNDLDIEIGNCFLRFEHEPEVREYFCNRFSGYKNGSLGVHYVNPSSNQFDNNYETYDEITLVDTPSKEYKIIDDGQGTFFPSTYNDGQPFVPGDGCGYVKDNGVTDYFYGIAPGQVSSFINFPNQGNQTIAFGNNAHQGGVDSVDDANNGSTTINGIRYNRSQTPYYLYFGLLPGKTALHKTVGKFFADKINAVTLQGVGSTDDQSNENTQNKNNIRKTVDNPFSIYKTCLGETLLEGASPGNVIPSGGANNIDLEAADGLVPPDLAPISVINGGGVSTGGNTGSGTGVVVPNMGAAPVGFTPMGGLTNPPTNDYTISGLQTIGYNYPSMTSNNIVINVLNAPAQLEIEVYGGTFDPNFPSNNSNSAGAGTFNLLNGGTNTSVPSSVATFGESSNQGGGGQTITNNSSVWATNESTITVTINITQTGTYDLHMGYSPLNCNYDGFMKIT